MKRNSIERSVIRMFVLLALLFTAIPIGARENPPEQFRGYVKIVKFHLDYQVNADGTYTLTREAILEVLAEQGIKSANHAGLSYSDSLEEAVILSACTLKKDGRRIDVPAENIQEREAVADGGPMFSDIKSKVVIFPDVAVGDKVGFSYKIVRKTALYPGQFSLTEVFTNFVVYEDVRVSVSVPSKTLDLKVFSTGVQGGRVEDKDGRSRWVWTHRNDKIVAPESGSVSALDYGARIIVSSFKDYGAIAAAYEERARPKAAVSDKVRALATELTAGVDEPREKAKALYTWVVQNIRFAGNTMGIGSVVPHEADMVLANRLGDCKDHVTLYQALLAAVGIDSTPVLINAGSSFKLPAPPSLSALNHVIIYIPGLDLYADPSAEFTPFGMLPHYVSRKSAIHTAGFAGVRMTPIASWDSNTTSTKMVLRIHEDGSGDGETHNEDTGTPAIGVKAAAAQIRPDMEDRFARGILEGSGYTGTGTFTKSDPREMSDRYSYGMKYHLNNALNLPGPGAVYIHPIFPGAVRISDVIGGLNMPEKTLDFVCLGGILREEFTLEFPKNVKIISLPKDVHLSGGKLRYDATYRRDGNTVTVVRKLEDRTEGPICPARDDKEFRPVARDILKDLKAQLMYQPAD